MPRQSPRTRQRGLAMVVVIVLLTLISAYLISSGIIKTNTASRYKSRLTKAVNRLASA